MEIPADPTRTTLIIEHKSTHWVIAHGDPDVTGVIFWCGYARLEKEHQFSREHPLAVRFCREDDARRAGVGLTKGVKYVEYTDDGKYVREER